jgi:hypothetical protein
MSLPNRVSAALTQADIDAVLAAIKTVNDKLPFLITLTQEERQSLPRFDASGQPWAAKLLETATLNPNFLPRGFDLDEMRRDVTLWSALTPIQQAVQKLNEQLDHTYIGVAADAYCAALAVYAFAKNSDVGTEGIEGIMDELAKRFARKTSKTKSTDQTTQK